MTTRMYYPHQQAVARHPENKKNCYQPIFPRRLCQNLLFVTASYDLQELTHRHLYISHAISQKKGSTELCSALPNRLTNYKFIIQKLPSANRHETVYMCTLCPNLQGAI